MFQRSGLYLPTWQGVFEDHSEQWERELQEPLRGRDGRQYPRIGGGAFSVSGLYVANHIDVYDATQLAIDLSLTTHKWALYLNALTPNFSTDAAYSSTSETSGTGYTAGGRTIATGGGSPTLTESPTGAMMYDQNDFSWASPTSVTARGAILYADALAGDNLIVAVAFGSDFVSTAGQFLITWNALGVFAVDLTP